MNDLAITGSQRPNHSITAPRPTPVTTRRADATKVADAVVDTLDLSAAARNLPEQFAKLGEEEKASYLKQLARLLKAGIVGTELVEYRGAVYESFVGTRFADPEIARARLLRSR